METIATRNIAGEVQYILLRGTEICRDKHGLPRIATRRSADNLPTFPGSHWYPIEDRDTRLFNPIIHYREMPSFVFDCDRVLRLYPIRLKTRGEILLEQFGIDDPDANEIYMKERAA